MNLGTYGHIFDELQGDRLSAEDKLARSMRPFLSVSGESGLRRTGQPHEIPRARSRTRTDDPFLTMENRTAQRCCP